MRPAAVADYSPGATGACLGPLVYKGTCSPIISISISARAMIRSSAEVHERRRKRRVKSVSTRRHRLSVFSGTLARYACILFASWWCRSCFIALCPGHTSSRRPLPETSIFLSSRGCWNLWYRALMMPSFQRATILFTSSPRRLHDIRKSQHRPIALHKICTYGYSRFSRHAQGLELP